MKGKYTYNATLFIGYLTATRQTTFTVNDMGYEEEDWDALSEKEMQKELDDYSEGWALDFIEISWS